MKSHKLFLPFLFLSFWGLVSLAQAATPVIKPVLSTEARALLDQNKRIVVLDVRTAQEFNMGHIKGAKNIDIRQPDALSKIDLLDKNMTYLVHCRTNHRSQIAVEHMNVSGFKNVYQMTDGFNGWSLNQLPIVNRE